MSTASVILLAALAAGPKPDAPARVFVGGAEAKALIDRGAVVVDARGSEARPPYVPGARVLDWKSTRYGAGTMGFIEEDLGVLGRVLGRVGVNGTAPVLVYGAMKDGFGEEGRIWWTLRYLGVLEVRVLDGGIGAWVREGRPVADAPAPPIADAAGPRLARDPSLRADWQRVEAVVKGREKAQLVDARTVEEYGGATPYGEPRGGHIPGAKHLEWTGVIDARGGLLPREAVLAHAKAAGLARDTPVITYCTGGVRSAFLQAVLIDAGFEVVANYDGSWFDWSNRPKLPIERAPSRRE